ncbi:OmpA family protein [Halomonas sp. GD1P12]|uniref:OmpA family protein n=1 Tax=Halomonas sp. GD1P12 TaxID=2982691 RepID=UPI0021E4BDB2|nr:OmpA family protein [Halomonas sp. GD1P12]UYF98734.1 OmpA family protein [Halomonas sp. GD1P12]
MLEDHRGGSRHDTLLSAYPAEDGNSGWMISYLDIMTLLVALFVVIIAAANIRPGFSSDEPLELSSFDGPIVLESILDVPLPAPLTRAATALPIPNAGELSPMAISAALGVVGLPGSRIVPPAPATMAPPALLAHTPAPVELEEVPAAPAFEWLLPAPLFAERASQALRPVGAAPLADYMVILTDEPPVNAVPISEEAVRGAVSVAERLNESLYLPSLDGVEVARVAEGISLRVQDRLLFPSATAELTDDGASLVGSLLETIQRFDGEVSVEGHSDSQSINTPEYSSNWALSSARAIAIVEALQAAGVDASRLRAVGLAATRPLADNSTVEGRARNRRVEVVIHIE